MTFQVQRIGDSYGVLFTEEQMHRAGLHEGTRVDVQPHSERESPPALQHISLEEGMKAYKSTQPHWSAVYEELAK